jgi:hypothetical protein
MTVQTTANYALNVALGTGDLLAEKARAFAGGMKEFDARTFWSTRQQRITETYNELAGRGANLRKSIKGAPPVKRAAGQTQVARRQVKAATTSLRKAVEANVEATKTAAKKVG